MNLKKLLNQLLSKGDPPPPLPQGAEVYFDEMRIIIAAAHTSTHGLNTGGQPLFSQPINAPTKQIGEAVLLSIDASIANLSDDEFTEKRNSLFEVAKVRTWDQLEKQWEYIQISLNPANGLVDIQQTHREKRGGYIFCDDDPVFQCAQDSEAVGKAIRRIIDDM